MDYDYLCLNCIHEFYFWEGVIMNKHESWVECPHCKSGNIKDFTNEG